MIYYAGMADENGVFVKEEEKEFKRFYRFSSWYVNHRESLKKLGYGMFIGVDVLLLLFAAWSFLDAYVISYPRERQAIVQMLSVGHEDLRAYTEANAAVDLVPGEATIISLGEGEYDFYSTLSNPNADWWAEFSYTFSSSQGDASQGTSFILPGEEKPIVAFGIESETPPRDASMRVESVMWHRVDVSDVGNYEQWAEDRLDFALENVQWTTDTELNGGIGRVNFTVTNDTPFSYYDPAFYILLMRGSRVVGVNRIVVSSLDSFETEEVVVNWFGTLPAVNSVEIVPEVNIFDVASYKPLEGETTTDTRSRIFSGRR